METGNSEIGPVRKIAPQVIASSVKNLLLLTIGMIVAFPTILIPAVQNSRGELSLDDEQTSWIGSISYICQPLGSLLSGVILEPVGRKWSMMAVNVPVLAGWLLFYWSTTPAMLYAASCILGLSVGFMEAPILTYVGEISQPSLRGVLGSYAQVCWTLGFLVQFLFGASTDWRHAALFSAIFPVVTAVAVTQVPETPVWLLSRGREADAERSLRWLRGWVSANDVQQELDELKRYDAAVTSYLRQEEEDHRGRLTAPCRRATLLLQRTTLRPLAVIFVCVFLMHWTGQTGIRPFIVSICRQFDMPGDAKWTTVATGLINALGIVVCMVMVRRLGKRPLYLGSLALNAASCMLLGWYAYARASLPEGQELVVGTWAPLTLFILMFLGASIGILPIPWVLISEVFPFRTRSLASGISAAVGYVVGFSASKTFLDLERTLGLHGVLWLFGCISLLGMVFVYWGLFETEGRSLEDIEKHYGGSNFEAALSSAGGVTNEAFEMSANGVASDSKTGKARF